MQLIKFDCRLNFMGGLTKKLDHITRLTTHQYWFYNNRP